MSKRFFCVNLELGKAHPPLLHLLVDDLSDAGVPAVARGALKIVREPLNR